MRSNCRAGRSAGEESESLRLGRHDDRTAAKYLCWLATKSQELKSLIFEEMLPSWRRLCASSICFVLALYPMASAFVMLLVHGSCGRCEDTERRSSTAALADRRLRDAKAEAMMPATRSFLGLS